VQPASFGSIVVLGAGPGLIRVLAALRAERIAPTVIVGMTYEDASDWEGGRRVTDEAVDDVRRSLEALSVERSALLRAIGRRLTFETLGEHSLGNLVITAVAAAFDDYSRASRWLGEQLGVAGAVLPATTRPVRREIGPIAAGPTRELPRELREKLSRVRFIGYEVQSPLAAVASINDAQWVLLAPGALYRSVLSTAALPDIASVLRTSHARVVWIANLEPDPAEAPDLTAIDHLHALRLHGIAVDVAMYDPSATLMFDPAELSSRGVEPVARELRSAENPARHDPKQLGLALAELVGARSAATRARR
jgi:uncharacterized cofD-like protein